MEQRLRFAIKRKHTAAQQVHPRAHRAELQVKDVRSLTLLAFR